MISVICPAYKEPEYLDICIKSALNGQIYENEIIVVVDGTYDINRYVIEKYKSRINCIIFEENYGLCKATNYGVYNSKFENILVVNDDNVFPQNWDKLLLKDFKNNEVLSPNQIEPYDSMFKQFIKHDFGKTDSSFNLEEFITQEPKYRIDKITNEGSTLPFLIKKNDYLKVGGWDESYPGGHVVDWEFFLKLNLAGLKLNRSYNINFYHFVSTSFKTPEKIEQTKLNEKLGFEHFKYKWGCNIKHNSETNLKTI